MVIDDRKFAAFIRHFGEKHEGEDAYTLEIPLEEWVNVPKRTTVLPADMPEYHSGRPSTVAFVTFVKPKKRKSKKERQ